jgi:hypothetical protein
MSARLRAKTKNRGPVPDQKETGLPMKKEAGQLNQIYDWVLKMDPDTGANQVLPQIPTLIGIELGARVIEVVVLDKSAELRRPIVI